MLPGIGPTATIAVLLPITFFLPPLAGIIMLTGICYGAQYGGSTTAILVNLLGEASAVVTTLDGCQMAWLVRAGLTLPSFALSFGPAEYVALMVFGLLAATILASGPVLKAIGMILIGLLLGMVGTDPATGAERLPAVARGLPRRLPSRPLLRGLWPGRPTGASRVGAA